MNTNLLDDNNVESEYKGSFLVEIKKVEVWLAILTTIGLMIGIGIFFSVLPALKSVDTKIFVLGVMLLIQMGLVFYWSLSAFNYTRMVKWYNPKLISNRLEHLLESNGRLWRATGLLLLWSLCTLAYTVFGGLMS